MHTRLFLLIFLIQFLTLSCQTESSPSSSTLVTPTITSVEQESDGSVTVKWIDDNIKRDGFILEYKKVGETEYHLLATLDRNADSYTIADGLEGGKSYYFSVITTQSGAKSHRGTKLAGLIPMSQMRRVEITDLYNSHAGIGLRYQLLNLPGSIPMKTGMLIGTDPMATHNTPGVIAADAPRSTKGESIVQVIPSTRIPSGGAKLYVRAYAIPTSGGKVLYSKAREVTPAPQPEPLKMNWKEVTPQNLQGLVKIYETTDQLSGRNFHAWYAVADPSLTVVKRYDPPTPTPISTQAAGMQDLLVLTNASYFWLNSTIGLYGDEGLKGANDLTRGSLHAKHPEYKHLYPAMKGFFGVDEKGNAKVLWGGTTSKGESHLYEHPMPIISGEGIYDTSSFPRQLVGIPSDFNPLHGVSGGPVLLKHGIVPFSFEEVREGGEYYWSNYELTAYDIFGKSTLADRTAIGILADGSIVLFVCDGRIAESKGANLLELARILSGIGCVDALNLDGGGSTNMWVAGEIINHKDIVKATGDTRAIKSTIGFFRK